jgi:hypothetical protein
MPTKRMIHFCLEQQRCELLEDELLLMHGGSAGTDMLLQLGKLQTLPG